MKQEGILTGKLKYNKIDSSKTGTSKVTYTYKLKSGKKITASLSYKVVDTTKPKVHVLRLSYL